MNKQELIEYCEYLKGDLNKFINGIDVNKIIKMIEQLDEQRKPVVPQFVADWYEKNKDSFDYNLWQYLTDWEEIEPSDFKNWINEECNIFQTLVNMHQFGYTVVKEKRYLVKVKGVSGDARYFNREVDGDWYINNKQETHHFKVLHTRKELEEAGLGWVFDCEGIEIEEVEE